MEIQFLKGIGDKRARLFNRLGLFRAEDLLRYYPRAYEDRTVVLKISELQTGQASCVSATVASPVTGTRIREGLELYKTVVFDETGQMTLTFFNAPYVKNSLRQGETYIFYGKAQIDARKKEIVNPVFEPEDKKQTTGRILPVYASTAQLSQGLLRSAARQALDKFQDSIEEILPDAIRREAELCDAGFATANIHFPQSIETLELARRRLVFEELLLLQVGLAVRKGHTVKAGGPLFSDSGLGEFWNALPFEPTEGQKSAIADITRDCSSGFGMNRLIQGDVGSGKTAVAAAGAYIAVKNGYQAALMAPTEILARQHEQSLSPLFEKLGIKITLITGHGNAAERKKARDMAASGEAGLIIGTHALISESVSFSRLGLVITDEQHRFGVAQRAKLYEKGETPHRLIMSATPIPRTLARIIYGDLEVSVMRGMPPGRKKVRTFAVSEDMRGRIEAFVRKQVAEGRQVYIVCPLIEDEQMTGLRAAEKYAEDIKEKTYPDLRVGVLHGKVKQKHQEEIMSLFASGGLDILVATTVIEVGVNVPNATLMIIENAERFGLSQLHQLRGRVGRGEAESFCVMFLESDGQTARRRLEVLCATHDGFEIAEADLQLRGPGDFFGSRQHGLPQFKIADLSNDMKILEKVREAADTLLTDDPTLEREENRGLAQAVIKMMDSLEGGSA